MDVDNKSESQASIDMGSLLVEARENLGLTSQDIATQMNLAFEVIDKIEKNEFLDDIPITFVRGYIKSYATKVGLDTGPMLNEFDKQSGVEAPSLKRVQSISRFDKKRKEVNSSHYLFKSVSILILLAFLSFAGWELWKRFGLTAQFSSEIQALADSDISAQLNIGDENDQLPVASLNEPTSEPSYDNFSESNEDVASNGNGNGIEIALNEGANSPDSDLQQVAKSMPSNQPESVIDPANLVMTKLVLDFFADCWVKIVDARGEVIAVGVKQSGKHMPIEGVAPISVILGDPSVVTMSYAGRDYDLTNYRAGRRAEIVLK
jgi:cytoskeleton protein RodZ